MDELHPSFSARLIRSTFVASRTLQVELEALAATFSFKPGQAIVLTLPENGDGSDRTRIFSLCSAPFELPRIAVATRLTPGSAFKAHLEKLRPGEELLIEDPFGDFVLPEPIGTSPPFVFLAGGIGITPFRSMIREHLHRKSSVRIFLLTVNRTEEETPFLSECREWAASGSLSWVPVLTQSTLTPGGNPASLSPGRQERINAAIGQVIESAGPSSLFYVAGPPAMVDSLEQTLLGQFLIPSSQIRTDLFFGYGPR